jgi:hypothetical protein
VAVYIVSIFLVLDVIIFSILDSILQFPRKKFSLSYFFG